MTIKVTHKADKNLETIIIPIAGQKMLQAALPVIETQLGVPTALLAKDFEAESGEIHCIYGVNKKRAFLVGFGEKANFTAIQKCFRQLSHKYLTNVSPKIIVSFLFNNHLESLDYRLEAIINGLALGTYEIGRFKTKTPKSHSLNQPDTEIQIECEPEMITPLTAAYKRGLAIAETQISVLDLVNAPSNKKVPGVLAQWALSSSKEHGFTARVFDKKQIQKTGLEALLAVNRGSEDPPVFIIMEYKGGGKKAPKIGLVGKGVTFDTGGLSLKPSTNMHYMKSDMGGAAAVFGAMEATAKLKLPINLVGIVPATDNSIGSNAIKPSDVIDSYSGKTIEIIDTDAEGRLILADGIAYMIKHHKPEVLIDLATLTGSAVHTFGYHAAAMFSNNDQLAAQLAKIGDRTGERLWRLPVWDVYKEDLKSDVADIRNYSGKPLSGAIGAAKFLEYFTDNHPTWAHLDIAGVAFSDTEFSNMKSATGYGIRLLVELFSELVKNENNSLSSTKSIGTFK